MECGVYDADVADGDCVWGDAFDGAVWGATYIIPLLAVEALGPIGVLIYVNVK